MANTVPLRQAVYLACPDRVQENARNPDLRIGLMTGDQAKVNLTTFEVQDEVCRSVELPTFFSGHRWFYQALPVP